MKNWGLNLDNPEATFKQIDKNGAGFILFDEFSEYAIKASLDLATDENLKKWINLYSLLWTDLYIKQYFIMIFCYRPITDYLKK